ncbi:MAG: dTMP kinase [Candidatus Gastranaerophilaceae bacterium]
MIKNSYPGKLIAFDGPNGSGKSTLLHRVASNLSNRGYAVYTTKEPTLSKLGSFIREYSENHGKQELACLVAADRYNHLNNEIIPKLSDGNIVLTDRYILSSLILQPIDGVDEKYILEINKDIIAPDLQISVNAKCETLQKRLNERAMLTRFELGNQSNKEIEHQKEGLKILHDNKINVLEINNDNNLTKNVRIIESKIIELYGEQNER